MKVLILAAGYGTRLARDLEAEGVQGHYAHLVGVAKPLLPVGGIPLISHWLALLGACPDAQGDVYVVVNDATRNQFEAWAKEHPQVRLVSDGSTHNDSRSGAVACIQLAIRHFGIHDNLLIIAGDTLFYSDFSLSSFMAAFHQLPSGEKGEEGGGRVMVTSYRCKDHETSQRGILEVDARGRVTSFLEKPSAESTESRQACPAFYLISRNALPLVDQFLQEKQSAPLAEKDAPGNLVKYICSQVPVYTTHVSGRFDIGHLQSYQECLQHFSHT